MADQTQVYRTGDRVPEPGQYTCDAGQRKLFRQGDVFDPCPESGSQTVWRRTDDYK